MKKRRPSEKGHLFAVGKRIEEIGGHKGRNRLGEIFSIIDGRRGKTLELILLNPHDLSPVTKGQLGTYKRFKLPETRCRKLDEGKFSKKRTFRIGDIVRKSYGTYIRYGVIVNFVHPDGLLSNSHLEGYNGLDFLECIEISTKPGLERRHDSEGNPKRFTTSSHNCKICKVKPMDKEGGLRLDKSELK